MSSHAEANIPNLIRQHLVHKSIPHALGPNKATLERAEVCLLNDDQGIVQVFTASNSIVDLEKIRSITHRPLNPMPKNEIEKLKAQLNIHTFPAFDDLFPSLTIIDQALYEAERVYIYSGNAEHLLALKSPTDMKRKDDTQIAEVATRVPVEDLDYDLSLFDHDRNEINKAVTKFTTLRIRQRLEETLEIPPLPDTVQAIIRLRVDPDANIEKLSHIVERDPSLAAQVVSWASSSYYSAPGSIKSVQDAIVRVLGFDLVMNLALGLSLGKSLNLPVQARGETPYWNEAVYVAATVGALVSAIPREFRPSFGLSYLAGLLHNFGYLILGHSFKPHFETTYQMVALNPHIDQQHIEKYVLGITRDQIASCLMNSWSLPNEVTLGIRYQSDPKYLGEACDQSHLIYLAIHMLEKYEMLPQTNRRFNPVVLDNLNIKMDDIERVMEQLKSNQHELDMIASTLTS